MERKEFLSWVALTPFAGLVKYSGKEIKPVEAERNLKTVSDSSDLYDAFYNKELVDILGCSFYISQIEKNLHRIGQYQTTVTLIGNSVSNEMEYRKEVDVFGNVFRVESLEVDYDRPEYHRAPTSQSVTLTLIGYGE